MTYQEQLKDKRWHIKRAEILLRDGGQCQACLSSSLTPNVHHIEYIKGLMAWEYDNKYLITLCDKCHDELSLQIRNGNFNYDYLVFKYHCNPTYVFIFRKTLVRFLDDKGGNTGMKEAIKLLTAQIITKDEF